MIFAIFFFAALAKILFYSKIYNNYWKKNLDSVENKPYYFDDLTDTLFQVFTVQTTSNYPDIYMPIFQNKRYSVLFFIIFAIINSWILKSLLISLFYYNYGKLLLEENEKIEQRRSEEVQE